jgi:hypothetical protein
MDSEQERKALREIFPMPRREIDARAAGAWLVPAGVPVWIDGLPLYLEEVRVKVRSLQAERDALAARLTSAQQAYTQLEAFEGARGRPRAGGYYWQQVAAALFATEAESRESDVTNQLILAVKDALHNLDCGEDPARIRDELYAALVAEKEGPR